MSTKPTYDLTGNRFGKLIAVERVKTPEHIKTSGTYWLCHCDCGKSKIIYGKNLRDERTQSCGCTRNKPHKAKKMNVNYNLVGSKFERLTVISKVENPVNKKRGKVWLCHCDCGNEIEVPTTCLLNGHTKSCGCYRRDQIINELPPGVTAFNGTYGAYKTKAKKGGFIFDLTREEFGEITKLNCHYCGAGPSNVKTHKKGNYIYNGIDRIDSSKGYVKKNIVPCCITCNVAKLDSSVEDFFKWIERVYNHSVLPRKNTS